MGREGVTVKGFDQLFSGSKNLAGNIERKDQAEFVKVARRRAVMVQAQMPRRTGRLAASVRGTWGSKSLARVGGWKTRLPYLGWMEFGGTRGRPYVPGGRWIYPIGLAARDELQRTGIQVAIRQIRGFRWPAPR